MKKSVVIRGGFGINILVVAAAGGSSKAHSLPAQ